MDLSVWFQLYSQFIYAFLRNFHITFVDEVKEELFDFLNDGNFEVQFSFELSKF